MPASLASDRASRSRRRVTLGASIRLRLWEGLDRADVDVELDNTAREHRLRVYNASSVLRRTRVRWNGVRARRPEATDPAGRPQPGFGSQPGGGGSAALALRAWQRVALRAR